MMRCVILTPSMVLFEQSSGLGGFMKHPFSDPPATLILKGVPDHKVTSLRI